MSKTPNPLAFRCLKRCLKRKNQAFRRFKHRFRHRNTVSNAVQHRFRQLWGEQRWVGGSDSLIAQARGRLRGLRKRCSGTLEGYRGPTNQFTIILDVQTENKRFPEEHQEASIHVNAAFRDPVGVHQSCAKLWQMSVATLVYLSSAT